MKTTCLGTLPSADRLVPDHEHRPHRSLYRDALYAQVAGFRPMLLDLLVPRGGPPGPVVLYLHGGGFAVGSHKITRDALGAAVTAELTAPPHRRRQCRLPTQRRGAVSCSGARRQGRGPVAQVARRAVRPISAQPRLGPASQPNDDPARSPESKFLGAAVETVPELAAAASPVSYVTADAAPMFAGARRRG